MRGEERCPPGSASGTPGTPPRARGGGIPVQGDGGRCGNTPACAGRRCGGAPRQSAPREHPRVRGEEHRWRIAPLRTPGTPPRARGGGVERGELPGPPGNTPACAGRRPRCRGVPLQIWEHPRVRGEERTADWLTPRCAGTPPRARGGAGHNGRSGDHEGNTPACAGRRAAAAPATRSPREHPRVRGEEAWASCWPNRHGGTPPRARGGAGEPTAGVPGAGNTPACAGRSCH